MGGCSQEHYPFGVRGRVWAEGEVELQSGWIRSLKEFGSSDTEGLLSFILVEARKPNLCTCTADAASGEGVPLDGCGSSLWMMIIPGE